jgi:hypothetical protein
MRAEGDNEGKAFRTSNMLAFISWHDIVVVVSPGGSMAAGAFPLNMIFAMCAREQYSR